MSPVKQGYDEGSHMLVSLLDASRERLETNEHAVWLVWDIPYETNTTNTTPIVTASLHHPTTNTTITTPRSYGDEVEW